MAENNGGRKTGRIIIAVLATALIVFCVWAMSVYARGGDPLAWLDSSGALQTTVEEDADESSEAGETQAVTLAEEDVEAALGSLSFDGEDVSLSPGQAKVVLSGDGVWVEEASSDAAADMVSITARRVSALAEWSSEQNVGITHVTWICEDGSGAVRMAITMPTDGAPTSGAVADLLSAASGYALSGDVYSQLGDCDYPQSSGEAPSLPDGTTIAVEAAASSTGEDLSSTDVEARQQDVSTGVAATVTGGGASSSQGDSGSQLQVSVTIDATADGGGSSTYTVTLSSGASAYDALIATGANVNARSTVQGIYVVAINGYAEKDQGGESGWKYAVNGSYPNYSAGAYTLSDGDSVLWVYVTSA